MIKISIITVVKNGLPYLKSAIESVKKQKFIEKNAIEHIIVCSPSSDGTENYLKKTKGLKVIFDNKSKNKFGSINLGIQKSSGMIVGLLHSDDVFFREDTLNKVWKNFKYYEDLIYGNVVFSSKKDVTKIKRIWKSSPFNKKKLLLGWMPPHTSMFIKRRILIKNLYIEKYLISGDYFFILKLFQIKNLRAKHINENFVIMRDGGDSTHLKNLFKKSYEDYLIAKKFFYYPILVVLVKILSKVLQIKINSSKISNTYLKYLNKLANE